MSVLSNESLSHYRCAEATLPFSAVAQRRLNGKVTKVHERNFYESLFEQKLLSLQVCRSDFTL